MEIINKDIDHGKAFDWGKLLKTMQSTVIFIQKNFMQN